MTARLSSLALAAMLLVAGVSSARAQAEKATIREGMTEAEVKEAWGAPIASRQRGGNTYLFYKSDCQQRCGTHDVVILKDGKVVDAIARSSNHKYEGKATAEGRTPEYTAPTGAGAPPR